VSEVVVTGVGIVSALGNSTKDVLQSIGSGVCGVRALDDDLRDLPLSGVAKVDVDVRPLLRRRKDRKLLPRAAHLAIVAGHEAMGVHDELQTGLYLGVGREPPDSKEVERALLLSARDGILDPHLVSSVGISAYPPLASLKTLPNMVLAHMSIQLGITGPGCTRAGGPAAGVMALIEAWHAVSEGRCSVAIGGAADSLVDTANARDLVRMGWLGELDAPGEAAAFLRLESLERALDRGATPLATITRGHSVACASLDYRSPIDVDHGWCGSAAGVLSIAIQIAMGQSGEVVAADPTGAAATLAWEVTS
jgi:3-oxoacyl-[acyl-carrier-protein] synthase II